MTNSTICILMPGDMGHGVGLALHNHGHRVITSLDGRSQRSRDLAAAGKVEDVGNLDNAVSEADMILSILPPASAPQLATDVAAAMGRTGKTPVYVDCNAISTNTAIGIGETISAAGATFIDAGIIGLNPIKSPGTRFYVSGPDTSMMRDLDGKDMKIIDLGDAPGRASAMKMSYAALTKGSWSLWTAVLLTAKRNDLLTELLAEFEGSQSGTLKQMQGKVPFIAADSGRWIGEMEEIAKTFSEAGVSSGFHEGATWIMQLLSETPLAEETRQNMDKSRTIEQALEVYAEALAKRD